jgi:hypothetical protein
LVPRSATASADLKEPNVVLVAAARCAITTMFGLTAQLLFADRRQHRAQVCKETIPQTKM